MAWLGRVAAALAGSDPDLSWEAALSEVQAAGIRALPDAQQSVDPAAEFAIELGGFRQAFDRAASALHPDTLATLEQLLRAGLARKLEREQHRRVQERLDMLSSASFEGIFVHVDGCIIDSNARVAELLGYTPNEILGPQTMPRCVAPEDLPRVIQYMQ